MRAREACPRNGARSGDALRVLRLQALRTEGGVVAQDPWVVCPDCDGEGKHVLHGAALTGEDIEEAGGDDFIEDMLDGVYDTACETCNGRTTIKKSQVAEYHDRLQDQRTAMLENGEWPWR